MTVFAAATPALAAARQVTVRVCGQDGAHRGQGLLVRVEGFGAAVLTCHHVIAGLNAGGLYVAVPQRDGTLAAPVPARYDERHSRPSMDTVVLQVDDSAAPPDPLPPLHALDTGSYNGALPATGLTHMQPNVFTATVRAATRLDLPVKNPGTWPNAPDRYSIPDALVLDDTSDAREGISGAVVLCENGVLGLAHFAREESARAARQDYLVPLSAWALDWPELERMIGPFVDRNLRNAAIVKRSANLEVGADVAIARKGFRPDVYLERRTDRQARTTLEARGGVVLVGKPGSGKTRLALHLLQEKPDITVLIPLQPRPPETFTLSLGRRQAALLFEDLHRSVLTIDVLEWRRRLNNATGSPCLIVCTSRDGQDWEQVRKNQEPLLKDLGPEALIFTSAAAGAGTDLTQAEGLELAARLGLSRREFDKRFAGTPGSLTLDLEAVAQRYQALAAEERLGVLMSTLLDAAKLIDAADLPRFRLSLLETAAARIIVGAEIKPQAWSTLLRRTSEEGFGQANEAGYFQIYKPILENCVRYEPQASQVEALVPILKEASDFESLHYVGTALTVRYERRGAGAEALNLAQQAGGVPPYGTLNFIGHVIRRREDPALEQVIRDQVQAGRAEAYGFLGIYLSHQPGREAEAEQAYRTAIAAGEDQSLNLGTLLASQPGREADAEQTLRAGLEQPELFGRGMIQWRIGQLLVRQPGRAAEAQQMLQAALDAGVGYAGSELGDLLSRQAGREREAEQAFRAAIAAEDRRGYARLANLLGEQRGREAEAEQIYRDGIAAHAPNVLSGLAYLLVQNPDRWQEAEALSREAIQAGEERAYFPLGLSLQQQGRLDEAEKAFRQSVDGGFTYASYYLGLVLKNQPGREQEAEKALRDAARSGEARAWALLGQLLGRQHRDAEAEQCFRSAASAGIPQSFFWLGMILARQQRFQEALEPLERAIDLGDSRAFRLLGYVSIGLGRAAEGEAALRKAIEAGDAEVYLDLGDLLSRLPRRKREAERTYRAAMQAGVPGAPVALARLLLSRPSGRAEATKLLQAAGAAGSAEAAEILDQLGKRSN